MALTSNGFLDNLVNGILGPKGNMADWSHASRLYVDGNLKLAPKSKFLYHTYFQLDKVATSVLPELENHKLEIGMLVKNAELPKYTSVVETRNKYNRKKNVQTGIQYEPITITFHDDNYGVTTALLEAYYRYYFADGGYGRLPGAFNKAGTGDNTYKGSGRNQFKYGLDNNITVPFFKNIQISQLAKRTYTTYTLVNPIITNWQHDQVDNSDASTPMQNTITVAYEAVHYSRGPSDNNNPDQPGPVGFGSTEHYDRQPSPISLLGGGTLGLDGAFGAGTDLYDYISKGTGFKSPLEAGLAAFQLIRGLENLTSDGIREEVNNLLNNTLGDIGNVNVSGVANTVIPKNNGQGGSNDTTQASSITTIGPSTTTNPIGSTTKQLLQDNPLALEDAAKSVYKSDYLTSGGTGGVNGINTSWDSLPEGTKELYREKALDITL